jgi:glutamyl-tRNA reductase
MHLEALRVVHLAKNQSSSLKAVQLRELETQPDVFFLDTCQRWVWVSFSEVALLDSLKTGPEVFEGRDAYEFLLRLATGLESKVVGETDIFGQMKQAWKAFEASRSCFQSEALSALQSWMQRVFEDTKEIRSRYMQNLGGSSYGTLLRKLIKDLNSNHSSEGPILMVGAGQIAQSVAPYLAGSELWLANRDSIRLCAFYEDMKYQLPTTQLKKISSLEEEKQAWATAQQIVICIPLDPVKDIERIQWFERGALEGRSIIHLGGQRGQCGRWEELRQFHCLTELFQLQDTLGNVRSVQMLQADRACDERSKLRGLGGSISIPHGWEDLAVFA